jgi:Nucleotidyltransferase domain
VSDEVLERVVGALSPIPGIVGIALGGSRARGTADAASDFDVGVYYEPAARPPFERLLAAVEAVDDRGRPDGYGGYGEWGPWVNGGAWLRVAGHKTDILLRDARLVEKSVRDCAEGNPEIHYQVGHPHGFCTVIYAGEVYHNRSLHDPDGVLARLRSLADPYPRPLVGAVVGRFGFEAEFMLVTAWTAVRRRDVAYVAGCAFRAVACLNQVVFAASGRYLLNEKGAVAEAAAMPAAPHDYRSRVEAALALVSGDPERALGDLDELRREVREHARVRRDRGLV